MLDPIESQEYCDPDGCDDGRHQVLSVSLGRCGYMVVRLFRFDLITGDEDANG